MNELFSEPWKALRKASDIARKRVTSAKEVKEMNEKLDKLLDLARCKCSIVTCDQADCGGCDNGAHCDCTCPRERKIPPIELNFLRSQRLKSGEKGSMQMMSEDTAASKRHRARTARQDAARAREERAMEERERGPVSKTETWEK